MKIGFDANPMVGDMGGVGWHSYHLLRTMLAQQGESILSPMRDRALFGLTL